jgi:hypothetical protein
MSIRAIFGLQVLMSFIGYILIARFYVAPRLSALPLRVALVPLLLLHVFRHLGMVFLVPTVVGPALPAAFAVPAAYGDLLAALLALLAIAALRMEWSSAIALVWIFNLVGTLDLINAFYQGIRNNVLLGAAYYIPTFAVPALFVTHAMIFAMLTRRAR